MKKSVFVLLVFLILSADWLSAQQLNLDTIIERAARGVEEVLPQGTMVAVLNFVSPSEAFSDYVIEELTGKLVTGRRVTIVDRRNLALISQEMNLQLSGDVSDESAQAIGRMLGAQSIVSGTLTNMGTFHRFRIRVINVETAAIQTQVSLDLRNDAQVAFLLGSSQPSIPAVTSDGAMIGGATIEGTIVPGANLTAKLNWLDRNADSHNTYIVEVNANENIAPHTFEFRGAINITIVLRGVGANRVIRLRSNGIMFTIRPNVTLVLDNNITLQGHRGNRNTGGGTGLVWVNGGTLRMNAGSTITGNETGGVAVSTSTGIFEMTGGTISNNNHHGVNMHTDNRNASPTFTMSGGTISNNTVATWGGGGVLVRGTFTMTGGTISGNTSNHASIGGGGIHMIWGTFNMRGGTIANNSARASGGGVWLDSSATFTKTGGIITGYSSDQSNGNVVRDYSGTIGRRGHAVFVNENIRKETTAGSGVNMSFSNGRATGSWN